MDGGTGREEGGRKGLWWVVGLGGRRFVTALCHRQISETEKSCFQVEGGKKRPFSCSSARPAVALPSSRSIRRGCYGHLPCCTWLGTSWVLWLGASLSEHERGRLPLWQRFPINFSHQWVADIFQTPPELSDKPMEPPREAPKVTSIRASIEFLQSCSFAASSSTEDVLISVSQ